MKKITFFLIVVFGLGGAAYFSGIDLGFLGLRSAILSGDNCSSALLASNKAEYDKSITELETISTYISLNTCEGDGQINTLGKNNFEIAACQRKLNLRKNKTDFTTGYEACQDSVNAGPRVLSGSVLTDSGATSRTLIEQDEKEDMHLNESVYALKFNAQGESYIREFNYEMSLSASNGAPDVNVTKAELTSTRTGSYACAQNEVVQSDATKKVYAITCRAIGDGYQALVDGSGDFTVNLNLSVSTILATGEGSIKFTGGKFTNTTTGSERALTRIPNLTPGSIKYVMAYVDPRDLSVDLVAQTNTSSTTIPVKAVFNKLINIASVSTDDFVITGGVTPTNLACSNSTDAENSLRTICSLDLEIDDIKSPTTITVDFPAGKAQDKTRSNPKNNLAATQKTISYVFGAPKVFVGAPCATESPSCSGLDNTPQLVTYAAVGDIPAGSVVNLYANATCSGAPVQTVSVTRDMPKVDLYERNSLAKDENRTYSVKIGSSCSSLGSASNGKQAQYTYTGETIAQVDRLACMSSTTFQYTKFSVGPFVVNTTTLCDAGDMVDAKKCNAWQGNATLNPECFPTGQGTLNNPYRICTPEQLQEIDNAPGKHFRLGKSIDLTNAASWFGGKGFQPIGRTIHFGFWGSLDGNGYEIQNLTINNPDKYTGLFGHANGASWPGFWINNLKLNNTHIQNSDIISGSLAGLAGCAIISGVESTGVAITGAKNATGGLIGQAGYELKVLYSKVAGTVSTADSIKSAPEGGGSIGGMLGYAPGQPLEIGYSESNVNLYVKGGNIGGLVGLLYGGPSKYLEIHDNLIKGNIKVKSNSGNVGGVLGNGSYIRAQNNIAQPTGSNKILAEGNGTVEGIGGFVGQATSSEFTHNKTSYSIQGNTRGTIGGFGGRIDNSIVAKNSATGAIGGENSKGPQVYYIGGFLGFGVGGTFTDNYTTSDIYLNHDVAASYIGNFVGMAGGNAFRRNYASGTITLNHQSDYSVGGFVGYIAEYAGQPYALVDNFSAGSYTDAVGLYQGYPDSIGGIVGFTYTKNSDTFENNYYTSYSEECAGKSSPQRPECSKVTLASLQDGTHAVYTRAGNTWDFTNTWKLVSGSLPELR